MTASPLGLAAAKPDRRAPVRPLTAPAIDPGVAVLRSRAEVEALAGAWQDLEARAPGATLFQSLGWCRAVMEFQEQANPDLFDPVIVTLSQGGVLQAVLPLERLRSRFRTALVPLGDAFGQYADLLLAPGQDPRAAVAALLAGARRAAPSDSVSFLKVREDAALFAGLPARALRTGAEQAAPSVPLAEFSDFDAYFASVKPKTRKNMRNTRNRLEREAPLAHHVAESPGEIAGIIARTLQGRADRLKDQGLTSRAFASSDFSRFCASLAARSDLRLLAMSLTHGGEPIAEQWGFVHKNRYYAYVASRDFTQSEESPGRLHLKDVIETCFARGLTTADLLVPAMPYKLTWAREVTAVHDYAVPLTRRGWLGIQLWDRRLRPALKAAVLALPVDLRTRLMRLAGRG